MLMSPQIRLIAAFDHRRHIFIDPDPDPGQVAGGGGSGCSLCAARAWQDYDKGP